MSEFDSAPTPKDRGFDTAMRAIRSFSDALATELAKDNVTRGVHVTRYLDEPVHNGFGTFTRKWEYVAGCEPLAALVESGAGEIRATLTTPDGERKLVSLGQTPVGWLPQHVDAEFVGKGGPDDFIMGVIDLNDKGQPIGRPQVSYLGIADLTGVRIVQGEDLSILAHADQLPSLGKVDTVYAFVL